MKGQTSELMNLVVVIVGVVIILMTSYFIFNSNNPKITSLAIEEYRYEQVMDSTENIFFTTYPDLGKSLSEILSDSIYLNNETVYYGESIGHLNVTNLVHNNFDYYFEKSWSMNFEFNNTNYFYGYEKTNDDRIISSSIKLPISQNSEVIDIVFNTW